MQANKNFLNYPEADEFYSSSAYEGASGQVDVKNAKRRLVWLYVFNKKGSKIYAALGDAQGDNDVSTRVPYPIESGSFISLVFAGGRRFQTGIRLMLYTDAAMTTPLSSADVWVDAGFVAYA